MKVPSTLADLDPWNAREIVEARSDPNRPGRLLNPTSYKLFGVECSQPVMCAYERTWNRRNYGPLTVDADVLKAWCVEVSLVRGDFDAAAKLRHVLEMLGIDV
jgi:hypothetical protein